MFFYQLATDVLLWLWHSQAGLGERLKWIWMNWILSPKAPLPCAGSEDSVHLWRRGLLNPAWSDLVNDWDRTVISPQICEILWIKCQNLHSCLSLWEHNHPGRLPEGADFLSHRPPIKAITIIKLQHVPLWAISKSKPWSRSSDRHSCWILSRSLT